MLAFNLHFQHISLDLQEKKVHQVRKSIEFRSRNNIRFTIINFVFAHDFCFWRRWEYLHANRYAVMRIAGKIKPYSNSVLWIDSWGGSPLAPEGPESQKIIPNPSTTPPPSEQQLELESARDRWAPEPRVHWSEQCSDVHREAGGWGHQLLRLVCILPCPMFRLLQGSRRA